MLRRVCTTVALFTMIGVSAARADVKLPAIFGDNMVLQRDAKVAIWGWAVPGEKVTVTLSKEQTHSRPDPKGEHFETDWEDEPGIETTANKNGKWAVELARHAAEPSIYYRLVVAGKTNVVLQHICFGDVWIGSGQSNMEMSVGGVKDAAKEIAAATQPEIRLFTVPRSSAATTQSDCAGKWFVCDPKTVGGFSAALYFFGLDLRNKLGVPMGLIHSSVGGTPIEAWTNPGGLYKGMIAPLIPLTIKGVIWYQGESNAGNAALYQTQLPAMIRDWSKQFGQDFPFLIVQLANFQGRAADPTDTGWARLREAQLKTWQTVPKTGMAVIIDVGEADNIHPRDKQTVGKRLALAARSVAYGEKDIEYSGPIFKSMKIDGNKVHLTFDHVGGGLFCWHRPDEKPPNGLPVWTPDASPAPLSGFAVAGEDHKFFWAKASFLRLAGDEVVLTCDNVDKPVAVRYGWADNPNCNLYNKEGLPASPFRTDDWAMGK